MTRESEWSPPTYECLYPERWHAPDQDSTESEVVELVAAMVRALQPNFVIETGTAYGHTAHAVGVALRMNGQGVLVSIEENETRAAEARERCVNLPVDIHQMSSLDYTPGQPIDFVFFDSLLHLRVPEFERYLPWMHKRTVVAFHDTGPRHPVRDFLRPLEDSGVLCPIYLPTPRGICFSRVNK